MAKVSLKVGCEGPKWDPYRYDEWRVERNGKTIVGRFGLVVRVSINGVEVTCQEKTDKELYELFERHVGVSIKTLEKAFQRYRSTCRECGGNRVKGRPGFPGETLWVCVKCDAVVSCDFDESVVM